VDWRQERVDLGEAETLILGRGGWAFWEIHPWEHDIRVLLRSDDPDGRIYVTELMVAALGRPDGRFEGRGVLTTRFLKELNLGRLEAVVNSPDVRPAVMDAIGARTGRRFDPASRPTQEDMRAAFDLPLYELAGDLTIPRPEGRSELGDDFYRSVASALARARQSSQRPAVDLAKANDVPVSTVHRWIKEARRRGIVPPSGRQQGSRAD
jgi:hypothetical protein